jgi:EmrB/QacA subfamily drug resistance transporter
MAVVMAGVLMSAADTTAVVLGLPVMIKDLHGDIVSMVWVIMAYVLVMTVFGAQVGKLGDMYGRVRMYNLGFAAFTVASVMCGLSTSGSELIAFRVAQGIGGALISSNSSAIIADAFERSERGRAYGVIGIGYSIGAILGILLGGVLTTFLGWRYIFLINLPVGAVGTVLGYVKLTERSPRIRGRFDLVGMGLFGLGLFLILYSLTAVTGPGFTLFYDELIALGAAAIVGFAMWERRFPQPLIPLSLLRRWALSASLLAVFLQWIASYAVIFLMIMYLQGPRGLTPFDAALLYVPAYVLASLISPFSGRLADRLGARVIASLGLALQAAGFIVYATLGANTSLAVVVAGAFMAGAGGSFFFPANTKTVMNSSPPEAYGVVSGLSRTFTNAGLVCSLAVALLLASISIPRQLALGIFLGVGGISLQLSAAYIDGMHSALLVFIGIIAFAVVLSLSRGKDVVSPAPWR